ncbi:hypothetical protein G6O69_34220 [Pseudenhygromyxa sp. WMMC2535]|uniref:hypothetical protein n=1 Tax=Pseudenhygromyxa sp. WMMC2535 TaxID=2712867 RepID=UPI0015520123|nr:hypothetical protein [Pseudenhygromyxa sp. WMMC2535]NVB42928.1 hypothetical protein [Pseudenhygromyxa sp. WMMC2535]
MSEKQSSSESTPAKLDLYAAKYMASDSPAVVLSKTRASWQAPAFGSATALFILLWCATHASLGLPLGLLLSAGVLLLSLFFAVLRIKVTPEFIDVHYGLLGPKIPLEAIETVEAVTHGRDSWLRWGISPLSRGEWLYSIAGDEGRAVKIVWRDAGGRRRTHYLGSPDHQALASSIRAAQRLALEDKDLHALPASNEPSQPG